MSNGREIRTMRSMLEAIGVPCDGVLLVHSAFKGLAQDGYDADATLDGLAEYMDGGTLLLPTMSWRFVKPDAPEFDELETPSNVGILTEKFRTRLAERRSLHPTHSVAGRGRRAEEILSGHQHCITPCCERSPFGVMADLDGWIVMLGVGMDCCTLIHHVEELMAPDIYCKPESQIERYRCRDRHGGTTEVLLRRHRFLPRNYWQFQDIAAAQGKLRIYRCDNAIAIGFRAQVMREIVSSVLTERPDAVIARSGQRYRMM